MLDSCNGATTETLDLDAVAADGATVGDGRGAGMILDDTELFACT